MSLKIEYNSKKMKKMITKILLFQILIKLIQITKKNRPKFLNKEGSNNNRLSLLNINNINNNYLSKKGWKIINIVLNRNFRIKRYNSNKDKDKIKEIKDPTELHLKEFKKINNNNKINNRKTIKNNMLKNTIVREMMKMLKLHKIKIKVIFIKNQKILN